jgi:hypothetical protein
MNLDNNYAEKMSRAALEAPSGKESNHPAAESAPAIQRYTGASFPAPHTLPVIQLFANADFSEENQVKAGAPATYRIGSWFVKKWAHHSAERSDAMLTNWNAASAANVPTPNFKREVISDVPGQYVFASKACKGDSFAQIGKAGHGAKINAWLAKDHSQRMLRRYRAIFAAASMGDPQFFFKDEIDDESIEFIDIMPMAHNQFADQLAALDARIA